MRKYTFFTFLLAAMIAGYSGLSGATQIAFNNLQLTGNANKSFRPFTVEARFADASVDVAYSGSVTLAKVSGAGTLGGTVTKSFVNGVATFSDIAFSSSGSYVISATPTGLSAIQSSTLQVYGQLTMTELMVPKFMKSATSTTRIPAFALVRFDNLIPNTAYRYCTGAVTSPAQTNTIGDGINIHYNATTQTFVSNSNRNLSSASVDYSTFTTSGNQTSMTLWVNMLPTANTSFSEGSSLNWRVVLTNAPGFPADTFNTTSTTKALEFGASSTQATGIYDSQSGLASKTYVCLFDNTSGLGSPLSTALVQDEGTTAQSGTTVQYYTNLENVTGAWSTIIPNNLPTGVQRIEQRSLADGSLIKSWTDNDGNWSNVNTVNQNLGATAFNLNTPQIAFQSPLGGEVYCTNSPATIRWTSRGVQNLRIEYAIGNSSYALIAANADGFAQAYNWILTNITDSTTQLTIRLTDVDHPSVTVTSGKISLYTPPTIEVQPVSQNTCTGDTVSLTVKAFGNIFRYQWQKDGVDIPGETSRTITMPKVTVNHSGFYTAKIIGFGPCSTVISGVATVFITPPIQIVKQPEDRTFAIGATARISVDVIGTNNHKFQWYRGTVPVQNTSRISGAQEATLVIRNYQASDAGSNYYCVITGSAVCGSATSRTVSVTSGVLTANQDTVSACIGSSQQVRSLQVVQPSNTQLFFQWSRNGKPLVDGSKYSGTNTANLTINSIEKLDEGYYSVNVTAPAISGDVTMNHLVRVAPQLKIIKQLPDVEFCNGEDYNVSFVVNDTTAILQYAVAYLVDGFAAVTPVYTWGAKSHEVDINSNTISVKFNLKTTNDTSDLKIVNIVYLKTACGTDSLVFHPRLITKTQIFGAPKPIDTIKAGGILHLGISAVSTHPLQYRWKKDGKILDGEYSPLLHKIAISKADSGTYQCLVSNGCDTVTVSMKIVVVTSTGVDEFSQNGYQLEQSIPNPASSTVTFGFTLPESGNVKLSVTDMLGRNVWQSPNDEMSSGSHSVTVDVSTLPNGVYYYTLSTSKTSLTRKLEIVR